MAGIGSVLAKGKEFSDNASQQVGKVVALQERIIERLTWVMRTQQKIADHLKIKLDDPLED
jgi:uncharacterized coiled-coil protein SlyX